MKAQVLYGINDLRYEENYKMPNVAENEILLRVNACGICGSDVDRVFKTGTYNFPTIIGHEFSGKVVEVGDTKNSYWLDKRVSVFPLIPCKKCIPCKLGEFQLCENYNYLGSRCNGGFAEYVAVPVWNLVELPENISYEEGAMFEPLAVCIHALKFAGNLIGKSIVIFGTGTMASILTDLAESFGCAKVIVAGRNLEKLEFIKKIVPSAYAVNIADKDFQKEIIGFSNGCDIVIEATGASDVLEMALFAAKKCGTIITLGNPSQNISISRNAYWQILRKELCIKGTWNSSFGISEKSDWETIVSLCESKKINNISKFITHKIPLNNLLNGLEIMKNKKELFNKIEVCI